MHDAQGVDDPWQRLGDEHLPAARFDQRTEEGVHQPGVAVDAQYDLLASDHPLAGPHEQVWTVSTYMEDLVVVIQRRSAGLGQGDGEPGGLEAEVIGLEQCRPEASVEGVSVHELCRETVLLQHLRAFAKLEGLGFVGGDVAGSDLLALDSKALCQHSHSAYVLSCQMP